MVTFADAPGRFTVAIRDRLPVANTQVGAASAAATTIDGDGRQADKPADSATRSFADEPDETEIRLAVLTGLVDDLEIEPLETGTEIRMSWPASGRLRTGARPLIRG
jgi:hypothetical protein